MNDKGILQAAQLLYPEGGEKHKRAEAYIQRARNSRRESTAGPAVFRVTRHSTHLPKVFEVFVGSHLFARKKLSAIVRLDSSCAK